MELPIFRDLESGWFRTRSHRPAPQPEPAPAGAASTEAAELAAVGATGAKGNSARGGAMGSDPAAETAGAAAADGWRTVADEGWRAASDAAEADVQETTAAGLPKRRPMAQLVPGGVEKGPAAGQRRSPEAVRGLLSAYHRGVQRGREQVTEDEVGDEAGSQSTQAGKERGT